MADVAGTTLPALSPAAYGMSTVNGSVTNSNGTQTTAQTGVQNNTYTPAQQAAQNSLLSQLQGFLSGTTSAPSYMTAPPAAFQAYNDAFNQYAAPGIAAQYGAGSPQIGAQQSMGNEQLAANLYQTGISSYLSGLGQLGNAAFNAVGQTTANNGTNNANTTSTSVGASDTALGSSLLSLLLGQLVPALSGGGSTAGST